VTCPECSGEFVEHVDAQMSIGCSGAGRNGFLYNEFLLLLAVRIIPLSSFLPVNNLANNGHQEGLASLVGQLFRLVGNIFPRTTSVGGSKNTTKTRSILGMFSILDAIGDEPDGFRKLYIISQLLDQESLRNQPPMIWKESIKEECAICIDLFERDQHIIGLECLHRFHEAA